MGAVGAVGGVSREESHGEELRKFMRGSCASLPFQVERVVRSVLRRFYWQHLPGFAGEKSF